MPLAVSFCLLNVGFFFYPSVLGSSAVSSALFANSLIICLVIAKFDQKFRSFRENISCKFLVLTLVIFYLTGLVIDFSFSYVIVSVLLSVSVIGIALTGSTNFRIIGLIQVLSLSLLLSVLSLEGLLRSDLVPVLKKGTLAIVDEYKEWNREFDKVSSKGYFGYEKYFYKGLPFRTKPPTISKEKPRILVVGDSFSWGDKIQKIEEIWPYKLESLLEEDNRSSEVINLSMMGASTVNEMEITERFGWELDPDLIILQYYYNDPFPSSPNFKNSGNSCMEINRRDLSPFRHQSLQSQSYLYSFLHDKYFTFQLLFGLASKLDFNDIHQEKFQGWRDARNRLISFSKKAKELEIPVIFLVLPDLRQNLELSEYPYIELNKQLEKLSTDCSFHYVNMLSAFSKENPKGQDWWVLDWDAHPNSKGHEIIAQNLVEITSDLVISHFPPNNSKSFESSNL
jgi:lysophospholipase L1-like esterase